MNIYNLRPYIGNIPTIGGYNLSPYILDPLWKQFGALAFWDFTDMSKLQPGATSIDVNGWDDSAVTNTIYDLTQDTAAAQPIWVQGYDPTGPDLVTNGTFDNNDLTGWSSSTEASATITAVNNELVIAANDPDILGSYYVVNFEAGKTYIIELDVISAFFTGGADGVSHVRLGASNSINSLSHAEIADSGDVSNGSNTFTYTPLSNATYIYIGGRDDVDELIVDNVTVHEAVENNSKSNILLDGDDFLTAGADNTLTDLLFCEAGNPFTIIQKFNTNVISGYLSSIADDDGALRQFGIVILSSTRVQIVLRGFTEDITTPTSPHIGDNTVATTWDGTVAKLYWNGVYVQDLSVGAAVKLAGVDLLLGARKSGAGQSFYMEGKIFKVPIFTRALSASEIKDISASL